jgi:glycosyltransferase involved in cell wall biosynthesis
MTFIFISRGQYPDQHAAAIRHTTIAQGLVENGHKVYFFLLNPQKWKVNEMNYNGIIFRSLDNHQEENKILKLYNFYTALSKLPFRISEINNSTPVEGIIVFSIGSRIINRVIKIGRKENIKIFHERTELPYIFGAKKSLIKYIRYRYYMDVLIPRFDGLFVISEKLKRFFLPYNNNVKKIPTVVDTNFFKVTNKTIYDFPYIGYCGNMSGNKDGIPILIEAFSKLVSDYPAYKLLLVGNNKRNKISETLNLIEKLSLQEKVVFTGLVEREEMPHLLGNASLLVLSKPDNEQNSGNFPIKIGEYLSTGIPVVTTTVGEIPSYIKDGETCYLAAPDSVDSFYLKMKEALSDFDRAKKIGLAGREVAIKEFDYRIQANEISKFIINTNKRNGG